MVHHELAVASLFPPKISMNQDPTTFSVGIDFGFRVNSFDPFTLLSNPDDSVHHGGVQLATYRSIPNQRYTCFIRNMNPLTIQRVDQQGANGEISFNTPVLNLKVWRGRVVVVTVERIRIYNVDVSNSWSRFQNWKQSQQSMCHNQWSVFTNGSVSWASTRFASF